MGIITNENIFDFCVAYDWKKRIDALELELVEERWTFSRIKEGAKNNKNPILENFIKHTFKRVYQLTQTSNEYVSVSHEGDFACFNLGLFTKQYERVYFLLKKLTSPVEGKEWGFQGFEKESSPALYCFDDLPKKASLINCLEDLIFDVNCEIRINAAHILSTPENVARLPEDLQKAENLQTLFEGAVQLAIKKVEANYKLAVPQYYDGRIQFLLPLSLRDLETVDIVMAVSKIGKFYRGNTCLTLDMAYNNARLLAKPDAPWLLSATE